jgi:hypothetical protein
LIPLDLRQWQAQRAERSGMYNLHRPPLGPALSIAAVVAVCLTSHCAFAARLEGSLEDLLEAAERYEQGRRSLHTWRGSASYETISTHPSEYSHVRNTVSFIYDATRDSARWRCEIEGEGGRAGQPLVPISKTLDEMVTPDRFVRADIGYRDRDGNVERALVIWPRDEVPRRFGPDSFYPPHFLSRSGQDVGHSLRFQYDNADDLRLTPGRVWRDGSRVILELKGSAFSRYVIDLNQGGQLVEYHAEGENPAGAQAVSRWTASYEFHNGAWVPREIMSELTNELAGGSTHQIARTIHFTQNVVNEPVDPDEFLIEKLGLHPGMRVSDHVAGVFYRHEWIATEVHRLDARMFEPNSSVPTPMGLDGQSNGQTKGRTSADGDGPRQTAPFARGGTRETPGGGLVLRPLWLWGVPPIAVAIVIFAAIRIRRRNVAVRGVSRE